MIDFLRDNTTHSRAIGANLSKLSSKIRSELEQIRKGFRALKVKRIGTDRSTT